MTEKLPHRDVVIVGLGWTGSIMAEALTAEGLDVVAIERGPWRDTATDFPPSYAPDELRYRIHHELFLQPAQATMTFRNNGDQRALPIRRWGAFMLGNGAGGAGVHWNAETWRFLPTDFVLRSHLIQRYGAQKLPPGSAIQDWGITYADLEPFYDRFEYLCGTSGTAGNLNGTIQPGGNPWEGPRSRPYPTPAMKQGYAHALFGKAAAGLGYHPFPQPSGNVSQAYTNPHGVQMGPCTYCGFCEWFGCGNYAKASPQTTLLPVLIRRPNFEAKTLCEVSRLNLTPDRKHAKSVTFVDISGKEYEQPADLILLCGFSVFNVHLMLVSGVGQPYDPANKTGQIGRNLTHQTISTASGFFDRKRYNFNPFMAAGAIGMCIDEFNGDNFDHAKLDFIGGGYMGDVQTNGRPIERTPTRPGTPAWGPGWKQGIRDNYLSTVHAGTGVHGSFYSYDDVYFDLDPTYRNRFGLPMLRMTIDFHQNELNMSAYLTANYAEIIRAMGAEQVVPYPRTGHYNIEDYYTSHVCGGAIMGETPSNSALNRYLQSWDVSNLFVQGMTAFPQNAGYNPTNTVGALAMMSADAIRSTYLKKPGPMVQA